MYHCVCVVVVLVLLLCQCCCVRERLSLARQQPACLPGALALPTYSLCTTPPTQCSNLLVMVCVWYSVCVLMQIDRCVAQYIVQQVCCVVHSYYTRVDRQCGSSVCSTHIDSITMLILDRMGIVQYIVQCCVHSNVLYTLFIIIIINTLVITLLLY